MSDDKIGISDGNVDKFGIVCKYLSIPFRFHNRCSPSEELDCPDGSACLQPGEVVPLLITQMPFAAAIRAALVFCVESHLTLMYLTFHAPRPPP